MHEWALAEGVMRTALQVKDQEGLKNITAIRVRVGELQQIDLEVFEFGLKALFQTRPECFKNTTIEFEKEEAMLTCRVCGKSWAYRDTLSHLDRETSESIHFLPETVHVYVRCPECQSPDFEITKGRSLWIEWIRGEK